MNSHMPHNGENQLYVEKLPKYLIGTTTPSKYWEPIISWFCRLMAATLMILGVKHIINYGFAHPDVDLVLWGGSALLLYLSELRGRRERKIAKPLKIFENGIEVYAPLYQRLRGFDGFIPIEDIDSIRVERRDSFQLVERGKMVRLSWAPLELKITLKNGKEYLTGLKPPGEIMTVAQILKERLNVAVMDTGEGLGRVEPFIQG